MSENYSVQDYVDDLRTTVASAETESEILSKVRPLAQKLVEQPGCLDQARALSGQRRARLQPLCPP